MKKLIFLSLIASVLFGCASAQTPSLTSYELPASVEVTFNVLLPENSPANELVLFTIVDDLTGVDYNLQRSLMEPSGERSFHTTVSVPAGTLLKYRYTRQAAAGNIEEITASGAAINYREFLVDGPGHVANDLIAGWADSPSQITTGQISGTITAADSGQALPNMIVNSSGIQTLTDADGHFNISGLAQGLHNIVISAPDGSYLTYQQGALVAAGAETQADMQLTGTTFATVTLNVSIGTDGPASVPILLTGNLSFLQSRPQLTALADSNYTLTLNLPTGVDLRYKYTAGDAFWNAEHAADGSFVVRQLIIPTGTTALTIDDQVADWTSGASEAIWFDLTAPASTEQAYLQFMLQDWSTPLAMWALGDGRFAYVLYSPTNFAAALVYRYCQDPACTILESPAGQRSVQGNQPNIQKIEDQIEAWQPQ